MSLIKNLKALLNREDIWYELVSSGFNIPYYLHRAIIFYPLGLFHIVYLEAGQIQGACILFKVEVRWHH